MNKFYFTLILLCIYTLSLQSQCYQDRHSTVANDAWVSCELSENPNPDRPRSHWIMYDFGHLYALHTSHLWNVNIPERTNEGISEAVIDYSIDGNTWYEWGIINLDQANASGYYEGEEGPDFNGLKAKYILITVISTHGSDCAGLSEIRIETSGVTTSSEDIVESTDDILTVIPNPADQFTDIQLSTNTMGSAQLVITDMSGRAISTETINMRKGKKSYRIETSDLANGEYLITIDQQGKLSTGVVSVIHKN